MPPVIAAVGTAFTAAAGAFAVGGPAAGTGLLAGLYGSSALAGAAFSAFSQIAVGLGLSALSRALAPKPEISSRPAGMKVSMTFGETQPQSFILGRYATAGDLVYHGSFGQIDDTPNSYYVQVIELSDVPVNLKRVWINGEWVQLLPPSAIEPLLGNPVLGYQEGTTDFLWVRYLDGTQTAADPMLRHYFGDDPDRPWTADMIGKGISYAIVTARVNPALHQGRPQCLFELNAVHYDPRKDSTAGGTGAHRWNDRSTWRHTVNPVVLAYNVLRGIKDPITNEHLWGGQGITPRDLPNASWFAAMNACDALVEGETEDEPAYRAGLEVRIDEEPAGVVEELLKACQGQIVNCGGTWLVKAGAPGPAVYGFADDDIIVTEADSFDPFPALDETWNGVSAQYPEPEMGWQPKDSPTREDSTYLAEDGGRRNIATLDFPAAPYGGQVQRLALSGLKDQRRFRRHALVLPPDARPLAPLDEVAWTSPRYGYIAKLFEVDMVERLPNGSLAVALQERDPEDYDWDADLFLPNPVGWFVKPPRPPQVADFAVEGVALFDGEGRPRRAGIKLTWTVKSNVTGIGIRIWDSTGAQIPVNKLGGKPPPVEAFSDTLSLFDEPATLYGVPASLVLWTDASDGEEIITEGIFGMSDYEVSAIYLPVTTGRFWSERLPVTTPDVRLHEVDLPPDVVDKVNDTKDRVDVIADEQVEILNRVNEIDDLVSGLSEETLNRLEEIADQLEGLDTGTIQEILGIGVAGLQRGWVKDPTFFYWDGADLEHWTGSGISVHGSKVNTGFFPTALLIDVPSGTDSVSVIASSATAGQIPAADPTLDYVIVSVLLRVLSGSIAGAYIRPEWRIGGVWTRGDAFGLNNFNGLLSTWGFTATPDRMQSKEAFWKKPAGTADAIRLVYYAKVSTSSPAAEIRMDYLDVRAPSEGELKGFLANGYADAKISEFSVTLTGPGGALAAMQTTLRAEFGAADASIQSTLLAVSNSVLAQAGRIDKIEAQFGGQNLVKNPEFSMQGVTGAGVQPAYWGSWDSAFQVVQRNSGSSIVPIATAPKRYIARVDGGGTLREVRAHAPVPIKAGQQIQGVLRAAGGIAGASSEIWMRFRWFDVDGNVISATNRTQSLTGAGWIVTDFAPVQPPAGADSFDTWIRIPATGTTTPVYFTDVEVTIADRIAFAQAVTAATAASTANMAIATISNTVTASFDDWGAFVAAGQTAVAMEGLAAGTFTIRAVAGAGSAGLRIVAWEDKTGAGGAVVLDGDSVIAPGTLSVGTLVVTDLGQNLVPDNQMQSGRMWSNGNQFVINPVTGQASFRSRGDLRYIYDAGHTGTRSSMSDTFITWPGRRLRASCHVQRISGTTMNVQARLQFLDKNKAAIGSAPIIQSYSGNAAAVQTLDRQIETPAGAQFARFACDVLAGTDGNVRFGSVRVVSNEDASVLITPDGAFFSQLQAVNAWIVNAMIANAAVGTLTIAGNAVTVPVYTFGTATVGLTTSDSVVATIVMDQTPGFATRIGFACQYDLAASGSYARFSIWRGGTELRSSHQPQSAQQNSAAYFTFDPDTTGGTVTYTLRARRVGGASNGNVYQRYMEAHQFKR